MNRSNYISGNIVIKETGIDDLDNVMRLWNDGEVMKFVGFPQGLGVTLEKLRPWLPRAVNKPQTCHYSIYKDGKYCGEAFYKVNSKTGTAALDIKLFPHARGKGIATKALSFVIDKAFDVGLAERVYVDPYPDNTKAWRLYEKLGFISKPRPEYLEEWETYLEITRDEWYSRRASRKFGKS